MKYILIEVVEREISVPEVFSSHKEAHNQMCYYLSDVLGVPVDTIIEGYLKHADYNDETCVMENVAWTQRHGTNFDWRIFPFSE